jgi:hypothetical protein
MQVLTRGTTTQAIMRMPGFAAGVDDVRNGRPPNYEAFNFSQDTDEREASKNINRHWNYERGRLWACLAPRSMPLMINGKLNPKAIALFDAAYKRWYII